MATQKSIKELYPLTFKHWSYQDIANAADVSAFTIAAYVCGKRKPSEWTHHILTLFEIEASKMSESISNKLQYLREDDEDKALENEVFQYLGKD